MAAPMRRGDGGAEALRARQARRVSQLLTSAWIDDPAADGAVPERAAGAANGQQTSKGRPTRLCGSSAEGAAVPYESCDSAYIVSHRVT